MKNNKNSKIKILVTGCAGFIGYHLCISLLKRKDVNLIGIDNLNDYYDIRLKIDRLKILKTDKNFKFYKIDIENNELINKNFLKNKYNYIIHLAAQAGVRYSIKKPRLYLNTNIIGFFNILENANKIKVDHFIYASTSSVYGAANKFPLEENFDTSSPQSFYAASKKTNEVMAHSYSSIHKLKTTGLRFFTVYGPYGRPDMALFKFTKALLEGRKISLFNHGNHIRDFTYIDDIVNGIEKLIFKPSKNKIPYQIFNIGSNSPQKLKKFLSLIERETSKKSIIKNEKFQLGDVLKTHASIKNLDKKIRYSPKFNIEQGIKKFIEWYKEYYKN